MLATLIVGEEILNGGEDTTGDGPLEVGMGAEEDTEVGTFSSLGGVKGISAAEPSSVFILLLALGDNPSLDLSLAQSDRKVSAVRFRLVVSGLLQVEALVNLR